MADLLIREVRDGDVEAVLANIRPADLAEGEALLGAGMLDKALHDSVAGSVLAWTGAVGDEVAFVFGLAPVTALGEQALPWLIGTPLIDKHRRAFTRLSRPYIQKMLAAYPELVNVVDARNAKSIAWLRRMGFTILPSEPMGASGLPFHPFFMRAQSC